MPSSTCRDPAYCWQLQFCDDWCICVQNNFIFIQRSGGAIALHGLTGEESVSTRCAQSYIQGIKGQWYTHNVRNDAKVANVRQRYLVQFLQMIEDGHQLSSLPFVGGGLRRHMPQLAAPLRVMAEAKIIYIAQSDCRQWSQPRAWFDIVPAPPQPRLTLQSMHRRRRRRPPAAAAVYQRNAPRLTP